MNSIFEEQFLRTDDNTDDDSYRTSPPYGGLCIADLEDREGVEENEGESSGRRHGGDFSEGFRKWGLSLLHSLYLSPDTGDYDIMISKISAWHALSPRCSSVFLAFAISLSSGTLENTTSDFSRGPSVIYQF